MVTIAWMIIVAVSLVMRPVDRSVSAASGHGRSGLQKAAPNGKRLGGKGYPRGRGLPGWLMGNPERAKRPGKRGLPQPLEDEEPSSSLGMLRDIVLLPWDLKTLGGNTAPARARLRAPSIQSLVTLLAGRILVVEARQPYRAHPTDSKKPERTDWRQYELAA